MLNLLKKLLGGAPDKFDTLSSEEFDQAIQVAGKKMILDVRHKHEYDQEKLRNSVNMDVRLPNFKEKVSNLDPKKSYFVYCQSGRRSAKACRILSEKGFEKVYNLKGGIVAYEGKTIWGVDWGFFFSPVMSIKNNKGGESLMFVRNSILLSVINRKDNLIAGNAKPVYTEVLD